MDSNSNKYRCFGVVITKYDVINDVIWLGGGNVKIRLVVIALIVSKLHIFEVFRAPKTAPPPTGLSSV